MRAAIAMAVLVCALAACARGPGREFTPAEAELVAWWVEDVAHGADRRYQELVVEGASEGLLRIAGWMAGARPEVPEPPPQVRARRERWPMLARLAAHGLLLPADGGWRTAPTADEASELDLARALAADEDRDRAAIDVMVLTLARADDAAARRYRAAVAAARARLDAPAAP